MKRVEQLLDVIAAMYRGHVIGDNQLPATLRWLAAQHEVYTVAHAFTRGADDAREADFDAAKVALESAAEALPPHLRELFHNGVA